MSDKKSVKQFILYDGRSLFGNTDDAMVLDTADSEREARQRSGNKKEYSGVWFEYDVEGKELVNEKMRNDL
jgi:hypothetical protein